MPIQLRDSKGKFNKGNHGFWLGKKRPSPSLETRLKMSKSRKGRTLSEDHKRKIGEANKISLIGNIVSTITRKKLSDSHKGSKSYLWRGGITALHQQIRVSFEYKTWRKEIMERDNYKCVICNSKKKLNVDHYPKTFALINKEHNIKCFEDALKCKELWSTKNNRTLCEECHRKTPSYLNRNWEGEVCLPN